MRCRSKTEQLSRKGWAAPTLSDPLGGRATYVVGLGALRRHAGMTLVELLVALVILSFLMTLVAQAVHQVALIAKVSQRTSSDLHGRWGAGWSVSALLANLVAPSPQDQANAGPVLRGSASQVTGFSTLAVNGDSVGVSPFELILKRQASDTPNGPATSILLSRDLAPTGPFAERGSAGSTSQVASYTEVAEFAFVDKTGRLLPSWPIGKPTSVDTEVLPRAIVVRSIASGRLLMWYSFQGETMQQEPPSKPFWEQQ